MKIQIKYIILSLLATAFLYQRARADEAEKPKEEKVKVTDGKIALSFDTAGGVKTIKAVITGKNPAGAEVPVKDVTMKIFIKKSFGNLAVEGDNMVSDADGAVSVEIPKNMSGDKDGKLNILAKVEDDPQAGDLEAAAVCNLGEKTVIESNLNKRALWAAGSNAPIALIISVNLMIALVWGTIFYILIKLITINKLGKNEKVSKSKA